jgi:hypothetical protein
MENRVWPSLCLALLLVACRGSGPSAGSGESAGLPPAAPRLELWAAVRGEQALLVLDGETLEPLRRIELGLGAHELCCSPDGRLGVGSAYGGPGPGHQPADQRLAVFDPGSGALLAIHDLDRHQRPNDLEFLADGRRLWVTSEVLGQVVLLDAVSGQIEREVALPHKTGHMLALAPAASSPGGAGRLFVSHVAPGAVTALDAASGAILGQVATQFGAEGIAASADGTRVWCLNNRSGTISVLDGVALETLATLPCEGFPFRVELSADGRRVLVSCPASQELALFDAQGLVELRRIALHGEGGEPSPQAVAISPDGRFGYVARAGQNRILRLDLDSGAVLAERETGPLLDPLLLKG